MTRHPVPFVWHALLAVGVVLAASLIGNAATLPNIPTWYAGLTKPTFNPPNWVFGPVWSVLYAMMAWAFFRILRIAPGAPGRPLAMTAFLTQMALNALWSVVFFGAHSPGGGLVVIALLWLAIAVTIAAFAKLDRLAAGLLIPYILWVSFAAVLNAAIWNLN